jgi:hypothetical protein
MKMSDEKVLKAYAKPVLQAYGSLQQITQGNGALPNKPDGCGDGLGENNNSVGSFLSKPGRQKEGISRRC